MTTFNSGSLGTGASCYETVAIIVSIGCSNFTPPRTIVVNGTALQCNNTSSTMTSTATIPLRNGGYCIQVQAGDPSYASFYTY
jgi:hypothetical protein